MSRFVGAGRIGLPLAALWLASGTNFVALKLLADAAPPLVVAAARIGGAALLLAPFAWWRLRDPVCRPSAATCRAAAISGIFLIGLGQTAVTLALEDLPAGIAAVLGSTSPLLMALASWAWLSERLPTTQVAGIAVGFAGVMSIAWTGPAGALPIGGVALAVFSAAAWAAGSLYQARAYMPSDWLVTLFIMLLAAAITLALPILISGDLARVAIDRISASHWTALTYTIVIGSIAMFGAFSWLNQNSSSLVANSFIYVVPVIALGLGWWLLGETPTPSIMLGVAAVLVGVGLMLLPAQTRNHLTEKRGSSH